MIGQHNLQSRITSLIEKDRLPRFIILVGPDGSGKAVMANFILCTIQKKMSAVGLQLPDVKADTVRAFTSDIYRFAGMTNVLMIIDADNMSLAAKNALLKVTEEPPNDCYFIMTLTDVNNTLETIKSRATIFHMDPYTPDEIHQYANEQLNYTMHDDEYDIIEAVCTTPGEVEKIGKYPREFYEYVRLVFDNIAEVSIANSFKIPSKVALKDDADGYDLRLFWKAFMNICLHENKVDGIYITSKYLAQLRIKGINKQMAMDNWILEIREAWA